MFMPNKDFDSTDHVDYSHECERCGKLAELGNRLCDDCQDYDDGIEAMPKAINRINFLLGKFSFEVASELNKVLEQQGSRIRVTSSQIGTSLDKLPISELTEWSGVNFPEWVTDALGEKICAFNEARIQEFSNGKAEMKL